MAKAVNIIAKKSKSKVFESTPYYVYLSDKTPNYFSPYGQKLYFHAKTKKEAEEMARKHIKELRKIKGR